MLACATALTALVGLVEPNAPCWDEDGRPEGAGVVPFGYYIVDPEDGVTHNELKAGVAVGETVWTVLAQAREVAFREFEAELSRELAHVGASVTFGFDGAVAKQERGTALAAAPVYGLKLNCRAFKGGYLSVKSIALQMRNVPATEVIVYREGSKDEQPVEVGRLAVPAGDYIGTPLLFDEPLRLPLEYDYAAANYSFVIEAPGAVAYQSKFVCCGRTPRWSRFMSVRGFDADTTERADRNYIYNKAPGINVMLSATCERLDWLCTGGDVGGFDLQSVVAKALQARATAWIAAKTLSSGHTNQITYQGEHLAERRAAALERFERNVHWLAANVPKGATDCVECADANPSSTAFRSAVGSILA